MSILIFLVALLFLWQGTYFVLVDWLGIYKCYAFPSPVGVGQKLVELWHRGTLGQIISNSLLRGLQGYLVAIVIGVLLGVLLYRSKYLQKNLRPLILGVQTLPSVCWVPFSILWFGLSEHAILFVVIMGSSFGIAIGVDQAMQHVAPIHKKVAYTMGANQWQLYTKVIFHAALPEFVMVLKQGWSFAWRSLMAGEVMTTSIGLGQTLVTGRDLADINQVALVMLLIIGIGVCIDQCFFTVVENHLLRTRGLLPEKKRGRVVVYTKRVLRWGYGLVGGFAKSFS